MSEHGHIEESTPWVQRWLRLEGASALVLGWVVWRAFGGELLWFVPLLLVPDVSMVGYLGGNHMGAITYNLAHNWFIAGVVFALGAALEINWLAMAGAVLVAHTGIDRLLGYGLKYPTSFQDTHLGRIGRR
jgi:Domain of unknown function (DUF4260)